MISYNTQGEPISSDYIRAMAQPMVEYDVKIISNGQVLGWEISRMTVELGAGTEEDNEYSDFSLGAFTNQLEASIYDTDVPTGLEFELQVGIATGSSYEYVTVGKFTVTQSKSWNSFCQITAGGQMAKMNVQSDLASGDLTVAQAVSAISAQTGVDIALDGLSVAENTISVEDGMTCKAILLQICKKLGAIACEVGEKVVIGGLPSAYTFELSLDTVTADPSISSEAYTVDGITVVAGDEEFVFGTGRVRIDDPTATQTTAAVTWGNLNGRTFNTGTVQTALIDPRVTPLDMAKVGDYSLPTRGISITYDGGYFGTYSASGLTEAQEEALVEGPLSSQVGRAVTLAEEAEAVANATSQHFWYDGNGAHVSTDAGVADGEANSIWNSNGLLIRNEENNLAALTPSGVAFYDGEGNADANITARFGTDGAQVGADTANHVAIDANGTEFYSGDDKVGGIGYRYNGGHRQPYIELGEMFEGNTPVDMYIYDMDDSPTDFRVDVVGTGATIGLSAIDNTDWRNERSAVIIINGSTNQIEFTDYGSNSYMTFDTTNSDLTTYGKMTAWDGLVSNKGLTTSKSAVIGGEITAGSSSKIKTSTGGNSPVLSMEGSGLDVTEADNGVTATNLPRVAFKDKNGKEYSSVRGNVYAGGNVSTTLRTENFDTSGNSVGNAELRQNVSKTGAVTYYLSNPQEFLAALGLGVESTSTVSQIISPATGWSCTQANFAKQGSIAQIRLVMKNDTGAAVSGYVANIGTVVSGKRPIMVAALSNTWTSGTFEASMTTAGAVRLQNASVAAGESIYIVGTYILG